MPYDEKLANRIRKLLARKRGVTEKKMFGRLCFHVRSLCSEGTRPRLPWAVRIPAFIKDPTLVLPILERLKDDPDLYVRRSNANHLGDMAKDHLDLIVGLCEQWLKGAHPERKWLIRYALRYPAKKGHTRALRVRAAAK